MIIDSSLAPYKAPTPSNVVIIRTQSPPAAPQPQSQVPSSVLTTQRPSAIASISRRESITNLHTEQPQPKKRPKTATKELKPRRLRTELSIPTQKSEQHTSRDEPPLTERNQQVFQSLSQLPKYQSITSERKLLGEITRVKSNERKLLKVILLILIVFLGVPEAG